MAVAVAVAAAAAAAVAVALAVGGVGVVVVCTSSSSNNKSSSNSKSNSSYTNQQLDALVLACYELLYQYSVCYWVYSPKMSPPLAELVSSEYHCGPNQTGCYLHK